MWIFILVISLFFCIFWQSSLRRKGLPPGPIGLPIIGSVIQVALADRERPFAAFQKLAKTYGNVMGLHLGSIYTVVVSGIDSLRELETNNDFMNRVDDKWLLDKSNGLPYGILFSKDEYWVENRRTSHKLLRDFGFGKQSTLEALLIEELKELTEEIKSNAINGKVTIEVKEQFHEIFLNVMWSMLTGKRFPRGHPQLQKLIQLTDDFVSSQQLGGGISGLFPTLIEYFPGWTGFTKYHESCIAFQMFFKDIIAKYIADGSYKTSPGNFIECFLQMIHEHGPSEKPFDTILTLENLNAVLQDLALTGSETMSNVFKFTIRYLVQYPEIQIKLYNEINAVVGLNRLPALEDKPLLKYTQATVLELLRITTVAPIVPRKAYKDCKLGNYKIPAGTIILPNFWGTNMDDGTWVDPYTFKPERFLNERSEIVNAEKIVTFGLGPRNCIGENLAKSSLLLTLAFFVQQFSFEVDPQFGIPPNNNQNKLAITALPYKVSFRVRH